MLGCLYMKQTVKGFVKENVYMQKLVHTIGPAGPLGPTTCVSKENRGKLSLIHYEVM